MAQQRVYRTRKEGGFFSSVIGMFIGFALVILVGPLAAWYAESQHKADDFASGAVVDAQSSESGYIVLEGDPTNVKTMNCPTERAVKEELKVEEGAEPEEAAQEGAQEEAVPCVYIETSREEYTRSEYEKCGTLSADETELEYLGEECDEDGFDCESCYLVESYDWEEVESSSEYAAFKIGAYTITPGGSSNYIGTQSLTVYEYEESKTDPIETDQRWVYTYMPSNQNLLVAGDAEGNAIEAAYEGRPFVVSNKSYQGTLEVLESQDRTMKWVLRIGSFLAIVIGMVFIVGPLMMFTNVFKFIPVVGKHIDRGFDSVLKLIAALIGAAFWLVVFVIVLIIKNIWIILIVLAVIGAIVFFLVQRGRKQGQPAPEKPASPEPPASPPANPPASTPQS